MTVDLGAPVTKVGSLGDSHGVTDEAGGEGEGGGRPFGTTASGK